MSDGDIQKQAFRWSEELRKAILRGDQQDAAAVFIGIDTSVLGGESLAITAALVGELVQFVEDAEIGDFVRDAHPATEGLLDDYRLFGRSHEFFSEVMSFIVDTDLDQLGNVTSTLIDMAIVGAKLPPADTQSAYAESWWEEVYPHILDRDVEAAVMATIDRGHLDGQKYMERLTAYTIESLACLDTEEGGFAALVRFAPETSALVDAYTTNFYNNRYLAFRLEMDRIGSSGFGDVLLSIVSSLVAFREMDSGDDGVVRTADDELAWEDDEPAAPRDPMTRLQDGQLLTWNESLGTWVGVVVTENDERYLWIEPRGCWLDSDGNEFDIHQSEDGSSQLVPRQRRQTVVDLGEMTVEWDEERGIWVADDDGSEWVLHPTEPDTFFPRSFWEAHIGSRIGEELPGYVAPKPPRPEPPDRTLQQDANPADDSERARLHRVLDNLGSMKLGTNRSGRVREKADRIELSHYQRTGRWLLGTPPVGTEGWYHDPTGRFATREWTGFHWTEKVQAHQGGPTSIDPDFPTEADMQEYERRFAEWQSSD